MEIINLYFANTDVTEIFIYKFLREYEVEVGKSLDRSHIIVSNL
jgi:hypothetical protein